MKMILADELDVIALRCAALPVLDARTEEGIIPIPSHYCYKSISASGASTICSQINQNWYNWYDDFGLAQNGN